LFLLKVRKSQFRFGLKPIDSGFLFLSGRAQITLQAGSHARKYTPSDSFYRSYCGVIEIEEFRCGARLFRSRAPRQYAETGRIVSSQKDSTRLLEMEHFAVKQK
jgi:hypothetical protein